MSRLRGWNCGCDPGGAWKGGSGGGECWDLSYYLEQYYREFGQRGGEQREVRPVGARRCDDGILVGNEKVISYFRVEVGALGPKSKLRSLP